MRQVRDQLRTCMRPYSVMEFGLNCHGARVSCRRQWYVVLRLSAWIGHVDCRRITRATCHHMHDALSDNEAVPVINEQRQSVGISPTNTRFIAAHFVSRN